MIKLIEQHRQEIVEACRRYGIKRLEVFGSAADETFDPGASDIDFFYEFDHDRITGLADRFFDLQRDLEELLGVKVDLVSASDARNPYFLEVANRSRQTLYAA